MTKARKKTKPDRYPDAICHDCGVKYGRLVEGILSSVSQGTCGWCGKKALVTEPRDYGYPPRLDYRKQIT